MSEYDHFSIPSTWLPDFNPGELWLVGAGPGHGGLMSLLCVHALRQADIVFHDRLISAEILDLCSSNCIRMDVGKEAGKPSPKQAEITSKIVEAAKSGKKVVRLKGGDPYIFGRGAEEALDAVSEGVKVRVIPGISAGVGGLAFAGIPLSHRDTNQSILFLTAHDASGKFSSTIDWHAVQRAAPVIVIYMGKRHISRVCSSLIEAGRSPEERAAVVFCASFKTQETVTGTLSSLAYEVEKRNNPGPALIVVGPVLNFRERLQSSAEQDNH